MKKQLLINLAFAIIGLSANAQQCLGPGVGCATFTNQYPSGTFSTTSSSWTVVNGSNAMNAGNWTLFNVTCGNTYEWSYCESYGGVSTGWDAQLTLYDNSNLTNKLCFSNDVCGTNGKAPYISWTATFTGVARILTTAYTGVTCQTNTGSPYNKMVWRQSAAGTPPSNVTGLSVISTTCNSVDLSWSSLSGTGITYTVFDNQTSCSFSFGSVGNPTSNTSATISGLTPGTNYYFEIWANNSCGLQSLTGSNCVNTTTLSIPSAPGSIAGPTANLCQGETVSYAISPVGGASTYTWNLPSGWTGSSTSTSITTTVGSTSGVISVTANNTCGSSSATQLTTVVVPLTTTPIITASPTSICPGQLTSTITISNPCTGCSYLWSAGGTALTDVVSSVGTYNVYASNTQCSSFPIYMNIVSNTVSILSCVGIEEYSNSNNIIIEPNPNKGIFSIEFLTLVQNKKMQVEIYNEIGEKVHSSIITNQKAEIDLSKQAKGIYSVQITDENKTVTNKKIIIQ